MDDLAIERYQQHTYRFTYPPTQRDHTAPSSEYFAKLAALRLDLVRETYAGGPVLDLCCGSGDYLLPVARFAEHVVGIDFSPELLEMARGRATAAGQRNVSVVVGNARAVPLRAESVGLVFSFSSLYYIPRLEEALGECARVLRPGGRAILEFGLLYSLNTLVCRAYPEQAAPCHVTRRRLRRALAQAGLGIETDHAFQLLPLWGERPRWLRPLLHPGWKRLLARDLGGRMLDERVSGAPLLRRLAFRHLVVCRRAG